MILQLEIENEVQVRFHGLKSEHIEAIDKLLAVDVPGARFTIKFKLRQWDGKKHFFNTKTCRTFLKLLDQILPHIIDWGYDVEIVDRRRPAEFEISEVDANILADRGKILRPYQVDAVNALIRNRSGLGVVSTGGGKTSICAALSRALELADPEIKRRSLIIVPSVDLINQTAAEYRKCGLDVGTYGGGEKDFNHQHIISTWQSLQNNPHMVAAKPHEMVIHPVTELPNTFDMVIVDEAHGAAGAVIQEILNTHLGHLHYKFGVTGTVPKEKETEMALYSAIGEPVVRITAKMLMDLGYLSTVEIHPIQLQVDCDVPDYQAEKAFLSRYEPSLDFLVSFVPSIAEKHGNTLVLVNSIMLGKKLEKKFKAAGYTDVIFISGESETELRKEQYDKLNEPDAKNITIASTGIASTGIDIPNVAAGVFAYVTKSFVKSIQSIGRYLRKTDTKNHAYIYDVFASAKYSKKHFKERKKYYDEAEYPVSSITKVSL